MELKNKIDWQVKNLQDCGLTVKANQRMNAFEVTALDTENFSYYLTNKEPKIFENTTKSGKKIKVLAWMFDNMTHWISIPAYKKIISGKFFLIALDHKFTKAELIKELDECALGFDDFMIANLDNIDYIQADTYFKDYTKLQDAITKNNPNLIKEEKEQILLNNKEKRIAIKKDKEEKHINMLKYKKEHNQIANDEIKELEKFEKKQKSISQIRKEELIKKISDLQSNLGIEPLNSEEIVNHLENEDNLTITEIETYIDRIISQKFEKRFLTDTLLIYLIKGISIIAKTETLTLNERNLKIDKYLLDKYSETIALDKTISDWNQFAGDDDMDEEDIEIATNEQESKELDEKFAPKQGEDVSDRIVKIALKDVYQDLIDKKVKLNEVIELLNNAGLTNQDIIKTLNYIGATETFEDFEIYNTANELASEIVKVYNVAFK